MNRVLAILLLTGLALPAVAGKPPYVDGEQLEFSLPDLDGRVVTSSDPRFRDKVLLIDLWGSWCPPCLTEIPTFVDLQKRFGDRGLVIVGIAFEGDEDAALRRSRLRELSDEYGINYLLLDGGSTDDFERSLPSLRNVHGLPVEILIDRDGRVAETRNSYGYKKGWARKLEKTLTELLGPR